MVTSVVIVDDHPVISHGLTHVLGKCTDLVILGDANNGIEALTLIERTHPDVVILDISLEGGDGISLMSQIFKVFEGTNVIMYTMHNSKNYVTRSFRAGALGYVLKSDKIEELIAAIRDVVNQKIYLSTKISPSILGELITNSGNEDEIPSKLTPREFEVVSLIAKGLSVNEIGENLFISPKTVRVHRTNIMHKFSCENVHELLLQVRHYFPQKS